MHPHNSPSCLLPFAPFILLVFDSHPGSCLSACSAVALERCLKRLEWDRVREKELKDAADEAEKERLAMQSIDW